MQKTFTIGYGVRKEVSRSPELKQHLPSRKRVDETKIPRRGKKSGE